MKSRNTGIRLNFYMKPSLVAEIDKFADEIGVTRSAAINIICYNWATSTNIIKSVYSSSENMLNDLSKSGS